MKGRYKILYWKKNQYNADGKWKKFPGTRSTSAQFIAKERYEMNF